MSKDILSYLGQNCEASFSGNLASCTTSTFDASYDQGAKFCTYCYDIYNMQWASGTPRLSIFYGKLVEAKLPPVLYFFGIYSYLAYSIDPRILAKVSPQSNEVGFLWRLMNQLLNTFSISSPCFCLEGNGMQDASAYRNLHRLKGNISRPVSPLN